MSKFWRWFGICLLSLIFIASIKAENEPITINLWDWFITQSPFVNDEIARFEQANPAIKVKRTRQFSSKYSELVNFAKRSENLPDILAIPQERRLEWMQNGYLLPIDKWADKDFQSRFPQGTFCPGINTYNGKIYSYSFQGVEFWCQLYLNETLFKKAGLVDKNGQITCPKDWDQVRAMARMITRAGQGKFYGVGFSGKPEHLHANFWYEWGRCAGSRSGNAELPLYVDYKTGRYSFNNEGNIRMFKLLQGLKDDGSIYPNSISMEDETLRAKFADGEVAMIMGGIWNQTGWKTTHPNFTEYACVMIPPPDRKGYRALCPQLMASAWLGMGEDTKHPEQAWKLIDWFAHPEVGARWVKSGNGLSIFTAANTIENAPYKQYGQYLEMSAQYCKNGPNIYARNPDLVNIKETGVMPNHKSVFWGIVSGAIPQKQIPSALKALEDRLNAGLDKAIADAKAKGFKVDRKDLAFPDWNSLVDYTQK